MPRFQPDPSFFKLPNGWRFSQVTDVACDEQDNVWVLQRPITIYPDEKTGPPVMEFDSKGNYLQGWGGPGQGYEWPEEEHAISIDNKGYVWISGNWNDDQILKFTKDGKFVKQFGHSGHKKTNTDTQNFWMPAAAEVYPKTNELFIADGYGNNDHRHRSGQGVQADVGRIWERSVDVLWTRRPCHGVRNRGNLPGAEQFRTRILPGWRQEPADMTAAQLVRSAPPRTRPERPRLSVQPVYDLKISNDGLVYGGPQKYAVRFYY